MKLLIHFFRLIRWPNLLFIILAQGLFQYCIYEPLFPVSAEETNLHFYLILITSLFIAAGGYIINDYFDVNIDQINRPRKVVVGSFISRRWVIFWHLIFSLLGVYICTIAFPFTSFWHIHLSNLLTILLLWFYSTNFKKNFLIGNIVIAVLTAWSIAVVYFSKFTFLELINPPANNLALLSFFKLMLVYCSFAFVLTLVRETLKDMEDMEGDEKFGCKTMPIVWGLKPTKVYIAVWLVVLIAILLIIQLYVIPFGWWYSILYCLLFVVTPLVIVLKKLPKSYTSADFRQLSTYIKITMLAGILSMIFFYFLF